MVTPVITQIKDRSVFASWSLPTFPNGIITQYRLESVTQSAAPVVHYSGLQISHLVTGLDPFTVYNFSIVACTSVGCTSSGAASISTRAAAPTSQPAPYTTPLSGGRSMYVFWDPPSQPNGEIQFYDVFYRRSPFVGAGNTAAVKLDPQNRNYTVRGLEPYTEYDFRVVSYTAQVSGSTSSNWTRARTLAAGDYSLINFFHHKLMESVFI